jgi:hypothetical protein
MPKAPPRAKTRIQPGDLRRPLTFYTRSDAPTSRTGGSKATYVPLFERPVYAKDEYKNAKALDQGGKLITTAYHKYTVRFNAAIVDGLYLSDPNYPRKMYVQGIGDPDGSRQWLELTVTDVEG